MKKKAIWIIALAIVLLLGIIIYFKPLSFSNIVSDNSEISMILNEYGIRNGKPDIDVVEYKDITVEQKSAILAVLDECTYKKTLDTLFSNGSMSGMGNKMLSIYVFNESSDSHVLVISSKEIVINGKNYRMKNAGLLIEQIIAIME